MLVAARAADGFRIAIAAGTAVTVVFAIGMVSGLRPGSGDSDAGPADTSRPAGETAALIPSRLPGLSGNGRSPARTCTRTPDAAQPLPERQSLVSGWPARKLWFLGLAISVVVAGIDAVLGHRVILIGLLVAGPCCVVLTGRWVLTGLTGLWVIGLGVVLGFPIWGTGTQLVFLSAVAAVALVSTLAAAVIEIRTPPMRPH